MTEADWSTLGALFGLIVFVIMVVVYIIDNDPFDDGGW